jgi:glycosyltransferase involved in cell wall biosynthesis
VTAIHDISFVPHPEWFPKKDVMLMKMFLPKTISIASKVLVPSHSTKTDLIRFWNVPEEKIEVVYLSGGEEMGSRVREGARDRLAAKHGIKPPFVFAVGPLQPRKNHLRLFEAMRLVRKSMPEASLVVAGSYRWGGGQFQQDLLNTSQQCDAKLVGYVENDDLADFYTACDCFCYPSLYEGFGIPILEAMRCAAPIVCSNRTSLPEVAGDAALFVDPLSVDQIADALLEVLSNSDLKSRLAAAGKARAAAFSWQETARRTVKIYQEVGA